MIGAKQYLIAKNKNGPAIIEIKTHRYLEHCGPNEDDQLGYRPDKLSKMGQFRYP